jgi:hypothetical protein
MAQAESSPPLSPNERADAAQPIALFALLAAGAALVVGGLCLAVLVSIFQSGRPFVSDIILLLAPVGWGLSVAARWQIRQSEGTRSGLGLANFAWWVSVVCGIGYGAYFVGGELAVRNQATTYADEFFKRFHINATTKANDVNGAFVMTLVPDQRLGVDPSKVRDLELRFGGSGPLTQFRQHELVRILEQAQGQIEITQRGIIQKAYEGNILRVVLNAQLRTPDGVFDLALTVTGVEGKAVGQKARTWRILLQDMAPIRSRQYSASGRLWGELQVAGQMAAQAWLRRLANRQTLEAFLELQPPMERLACIHRLEALHTLHQQLLPAVLTGGSWTDAVGPTLATKFAPLWWSTLPGFRDFLAGKWINGPDLPGRAYMLREVVANGAIQIPNTSQPGRPPAESLGSLLLEGDALLYTQPIELQLPLPSGFTVPGTLTLRMTNANLVTELSRLRAADWPTPQPAAAESLLKGKALEWRIEKVDSPLKPARLN